jgi:hypothetical protein
VTWGYLLEISKLQVALNRWAAALGVQPLDVNGKFDDKTATFAIQVALGYAPFAYGSLTYLKEATSDAERFAGLDSVTTELDDALDDLLRDPNAAPGTPVIIVPLEEGTEVIVDAVEEKNAELVAEGKPLIPTKVVGGGGFPWLAFGVSSLLVVGGSVMLYLDVKKRSR